MPAGVIANATATRDLQKILDLFQTEEAVDGLSIAEIAKRTKLKAELVLDLVRNNSLESGAQLNLTRFMVYPTHPQVARAEPEDVKEQHVAALSRDQNFVELSRLFTRALANASFKTEEEVGMLGAGLAYFYYISQQHASVAWNPTRVAPTMLEERLAAIGRPKYPSDTKDILDAFLRRMLRSRGTIDQAAEFVPDNILDTAYREAITGYALETGVVEEKRFEFSISDGREWRQLGLKVNLDKVLLYQTRENVLYDKLPQEDFVSGIEAILDGETSRVTDTVLGWLRGAKLVDDVDDPSGAVDLETGQMPKVLKVSPEVLKYTPSLRQKVIESVGQGANLFEAFTYTKFLTGRLKALELNTVEDLRRYEFVPKLSVSKIPVQFAVDWSAVTVDNLKPLLLQIYGLPEDAQMANIGHEEELRQQIAERQPLVRASSGRPQARRPAPPRREQPRAQPPAVPPRRGLEARVNYADLSLLMTAADTRNYEGDRTTLLRAFLETQGYSQIGAEAVAKDFLTSHGPERMQTLAGTGDSRRVGLFLLNYVKARARAAPAETPTPAVQPHPSLRRPVQETVAPTPTKAAQSRRPGRIDYEHFVAAAVALGLKTSEERAELVCRVGAIAEMPRRRIDRFANRLNYAPKNLERVVMHGLASPRTVRWITNAYRSQTTEAPAVEAAPAAPETTAARPAAELPARTYVTPQREEPVRAEPAPQPHRKEFKTNVPETETRKMADKPEGSTESYLRAQDMFALARRLGKPVEEVVRAVYTGANRGDQQAKTAVTRLGERWNKAKGPRQEELLAGANADSVREFYDLGAEKLGDSGGGEAHAAAPQTTQPSAAAAMLGHGDLATRVDTYATALKAAASTGRGGVAVVEDQVEQGLGALARYHTYAKGEVAAAEALVAGRKTALGALEAALGYAPAPAAPAGSGRSGK